MSPAWSRLQSRFPNQEARLKFECMRKMPWSAWQSETKGQDYGGSTENGFQNLPEEQACIEDIGHWFGGIEDIRGPYGCILALGTLIMLFGVVCSVGHVTGTFVTVLAVGWLLVALAPRAAKLS